ncbi:MAG: hypothetical protein VB064_07535 [Oscillospiraceae bacterium]|nr:hypothetical protein [Oscillospiraceae bacterium]
MALINGVLGPIDTNDMGITLIHEHLIGIDWNLRMSMPGLVDDKASNDYMAGSIQAAQTACGIRTIGDLTPWSLGRDPEFLAKLSRKTGVNIFCACGFYADSQPFFRNIEPGQLVDYLVKEIKDGIADTGIKPAAIKCATAEKGIDTQNEKLLTAAARAQKKTGLPLFTHSVPCNKSGYAQQDLFEREGVDLRHVVIGHCGDSNDIIYLESILKRGSYIGLDRFGQDKYNLLENRLQTMLELLHRGWLDRLVISHDHILFMEYGSRGDKEPPEVDLGYIHQRVIPWLKENGVSQREIDTILIDNPKKIMEIGSFA